MHIPMEARYLFDVGGAIKPDHVPTKLTVHGELFMVQTATDTNLDADRLFYKHNQYAGNMDTHATGFAIPTTWWEIQSVLRANMAGTGGIRLEFSDRKLICRGAQTWELNAAPGTVTAYNHVTKCVYIMYEGAIYEVVPAGRE